MCEKKFSHKDGALEAGYSSGLFLGYFYLNHPSPPQTSLQLKTKNWKCKTCGKLFSQRASLARHDREIHQNALSHECDQCEAKFTRREHLLRHVARIHPVL